MGGEIKQNFAVAPNHLSRSQIRTHQDAVTCVDLLISGKSQPLAGCPFRRSRWIRTGKESSEVIHCRYPIPCQPLHRRKVACRFYISALDIRWNPQGCAPVLLLHTTSHGRLQPSQYVGVQRRHSGGYKFCACCRDDRVNID